MNSLPGQQGQAAGPSRRQVLRAAGAGLGAAAFAPAIAGTARSRDGNFLPGGYLTAAGGPGRFALVAGGQAAPVVVDSGDYPGVVRVAGDLCSDIGKVTGVTPDVVQGAVLAGANPVIVGTIGRSALIDGLISSGKLDVSGIAGNWETSLETILQDPLPGVRQAFVIAGSDQRGTIFGAYDVSRAIGVSPWYWWDDVPPQRHDALYVLPGRHSQGTPAVRYRGFYINDENPETGTWAPAYFGPGLAPGHPGGLNHEYYAKIFELALRLKANYIWPAEWGRAFALDDPQNQATATEYGIVMGTSHDAPMARGIEEWNRFAVPAVRDANGNIITPGHDPYGGTGEWSFRYNAPAIEQYWRDGIQRMTSQHAEMVVTIGMRGNGDTALADNAGIDLMEEIISTERQIIAEVTGQDVTTVPQVWTLYKEVLRYWDEGLRPPDDVTVVFTDDNWGNIRQLPDQALPPRGGGYGLYYHFDYVGAPRNYKWLDTINLASTWEQLHLAYAYGDDRLWIANVGDVKNEEVPLQFFLDYAWNPEAISADTIGDWIRRYAAENFGLANAAAIADVLWEYSQLQSRRKPELLNCAFESDPSTPSAVSFDDQALPFSLTGYQEMDQVTAQWQRLAARADAIGQSLPSGTRDAWFELIGYEVDATANLYALRKAEFTSIRYAAQGRAATNDLADQAAAFFARDQAMSDHYNNQLAGGKWKGWQTQTHIGYGDVARYGSNATWSDPPLPDEIYPAVQRITVPVAADMGVTVDGSGGAVLPGFSPYQSQPAQYIDVFNRGQTPFGYTITTGVPWLRVTPASGTVGKQIRATVGVDWRQAPTGSTTVPITISGAGTTVTVQAPVSNPGLQPGQLRGFIEASGYVAMQAEHYSHAIGDWLRIPGIGLTGAGMEPLPVTRPSQPLSDGSPHLRYTMTLTTTGPVKVWAWLSPRNDVLAHGGLRYAISVDDQTPQTVNIQQQTGADDATMNTQWGRNVGDNVNRTVTTHVIGSPGVHTLTFWVIDPTVVLQRLVVDTGGLQDSYLGPPESLRVPG